jgi:2-polyprenyl-3-methyl-5-hydroxy-6-metoxy-1,4-benzoquinol methylase
MARIPDRHATTGAPGCWCGAEALEPFSPHYFRCRACETLVSAEMPGPEISRVQDDERGFYGREYWFSHQERTLGQPSILVRARSDLPERCLHWLRSVLRFKLPPARILEVGSSHGGFVAMLRWAGFEATGLEISPWVVEFARETFGVPMLLGRVEDQRIEPASVDMILLMDVLEHLRDPESTMRHCLGLLRPDGILLIQTPCYPEGRSHADLVAAGDRVLEMLQPREHLYLFSRRAVGELLGRLGASHVAAEPALFAEYDMFLVVGRGPVATHPPEEIEGILSRRPASRMVQALLDLDRDRRGVAQRYAEAEADRAARLQALDEQGRRLGEAEAERNNLGAEVKALREHLEAAEADRAARLEIVHEQGAELATQEEQIRLLLAQLRTLQTVITAIQRGRAYRLLRRLGFWKWFERAVARSPADSST